MMATIVMVDFMMMLSLFCFWLNATSFEIAVAEGLIRAASACLFLRVQVWGARARLSMLISSRENCRAVWINRLAWVDSPCQGEGRVRVGSGLIDALDIESLTFILSP